MTPTPDELRDAARRSVRSRTDPDPLEQLIPGEGREPAGHATITAAETAMGLPITRVKLASGGTAWLNVARVRSALRRWAVHYPAPQPTSPAGPLPEPYRAPHDPLDPRRGNAWWWRHTNPVTDETRPRGPFDTKGEALDDRAVRLALDADHRSSKVGR